MKVPLTKRFIIEVVKEWDIIYKKRIRCSGYIEPEDKKIIINANQPIGELGIAMYHEFLHLLYENSGVYHTHLQIEMEARAYYHKRPDLLDLIHSFL